MYMQNTGSVGRVFAWTLLPVQKHLSHIPVFLKRRYTDGRLPVREEILLLVTYLRNYLFTYVFT